MANPRSRMLIGVAVAVALAVGVAVAIVVLSRTGGNGVELPDEVAGLPARDSEAFVPDSVEDREKALADLVGAREYAAGKYSDAFEGADADVRAYADPDDIDTPQYAVVAVEADAGPVLPEFPFDDPELTQLAEPQTDRVEEGDAECLLRRSAAPQDADEDETAPVAVVCQRTSTSLTVRVSSSNDPSVEGTVEFLDAVWDELA